ncbi:MAG: DinB family protein [Nakamurella sp.]
MTAAYSSSDRVDPPGQLAEREMMLAFLNYHRVTLAAKVSGITAEQAITRSTVSELTLLGLIRHMTEVERGWIAEEFGDGYGTPSGPAELPPLYSRPGAPDAEFTELDAGRLALYLAAWQAETERTDGILAIRSLDDTIPNDRRGPVSLRWVLWHVFEEYARHNGHADIIREAIDGSVGE